MHAALATTYDDLEDEGELAQRWRAGDRDAGRRLVEACRAWVSSIAHRYRRWGRPLEDLLQEGNIGLLRAAMRYHPGHGASLKTYSGFWIRAQILEYLLRGYRIVRLGSSKSERRALQIYRRTRTSDPAQLAAASGLSLSRATSLLQVLASSEVGFDATYDDGFSMAERLAADGPTPEESAATADERRTTRALLRRAVAELPPRERRIVRARWLTESPRTLEELGGELGVSTERVRQLESRARERIRVMIDASSRDVRTRRPR